MSDHEIWCATQEGLPCTCGAVLNRSILEASVLKKELQSERTKRQELEARVGVVEAALEECAASFVIHEAVLGDNKPIDYERIAREFVRRIEVAGKALSTSPSRATVLSRFEVLNDGSNRWVLCDNESDDPAPVYETEAEAYYNAALQLGFEPSRVKAMRAEDSGKSCNEHQ